MYNFWILVANKGNARLYRRTRPANGLKLIQNYEHPEGRLKDRDFKSDRPGRKMGHGSEHHGVSSHESPEERKSFEFAHQLAEVLENGRVNNEFDGIILVAGPTMMGLIRSVLNQHLVQHVVKSISKDFGHHDDRQVSEALKEDLSELDALPKLPAGQ